MTRGGPATRRTAVAVVGVLVALLVVVVGTARHRTAGDVPPVQHVRVAPGSDADLHRPADPAGAPTIVLLHGCCGDRADLGALARALARRGGLVLNVDWTTLADGGGWPRSYRQATCAIAVARDLATDLGARTDRVVAVGWSDGALLAATAGLAPPPPAAGCTAAGEGRADAVVALAGFLGWAADDPAPGAGADTWFGGSPDVAGRAWVAGNPVAVAPRSRLAGEPAPAGMDLVVGRRDPLRDHARWAARRLRADGITVRVHWTERATAAVVTPRTPDGAEAVAVVLARATAR